MNKITPVLLAILDGWGYGPQTEFNAVYMAKTPNMDMWRRQYPFATLEAHNGAVGLPAGQMGNSEVGHLNIGAGRVVYQDFTRINRAIETKDFFSNPVLRGVMDRTRTAGSSLHLLGLLSDGGVHSHIDHLGALLQMAAAAGLDKVYIHAFMDGRDTPPTSGAGYMRRLVEMIGRCGAGKVASVSGRYYAMDRDRRWDRVRSAWQALVDGVGKTAPDPVQAVLDAYERGETDEFIKPVVIAGRPGVPLATVRDGDAVLFFNFRADRVRQLTTAFTEKDFREFACPVRPRLAECVTFTQYDKDFVLPVAFPPLSMKGILGEEISRQGLHQLRIAETEKYAHVTYFFNGGREEPFQFEDRVLVNSPKDVATYDLKPEMSAFEVTDELLKRLRDNVYSLVVLNFANGDMVGHSGIMAAAVRACEAVDECLGRVVGRFLELDGDVIITADHGNAELMRDPENGEPFTAHTSNPVPFRLVSDRYRDAVLRRDGSLRDIAPTVLRLLGLKAPAEMDGRSLIEDR